MHRHRSMSLYRLIRPLSLGLLMLFILPATTMAQKTNNRSAPPEAKVGLFTSLEGAYVHQFDSDIDNGGSFSINRLFVQGGIGYALDYRRSLSLTLGYGFDAYDFSGETGFAGLRPWENMHSVRISVPVRWTFNPKWSLFASPTLRFTAESGADFDEAMSGGGFFGLAYRVSNRLTIGPAIGVITQIEDDPSVLPILLINWQITDRLSLTTGPGLAATLGPGLTLNWQASKRWTLALGGRIERLRFRLDNNGIAPRGIGQERSFPLFAGVTYRFSPQIQASLFGGAELDGRLRLEDKDGNKITEEDYDPAAFLGFTFRSRF